METFSTLLAICAGNSPASGAFPAQRPVTMFSLTSVWINGWENNREAGDFRRYRAHYDVIVMLSQILPYLDIQSRQIIALLRQMSALEGMAGAPRWFQNDTEMMKCVILVWFTMSSEPAGA